MKSLNKFNCLAMLAMFAFAAATPATALAELKVGVVNMAQLLDQAPQARAVIEALQDEFAPRQRDVVSRTNELRQLEERFERDVAVLGDEERRSMERQLRDGQRELQRRQNEFVEDLNLRRNEELGKLQRSLMEEIQAYARRANYDLIVGEGVLYASSAVDITPNILQGLEANFRSSRR
ncbi:MAG: OmpH family outer membrane protein [Gammaproteobacteria bacterium]|nr:OmpH family outer membrane protein [Gammaproteobacteria bacterium]